jgi:hypothetical protein
MLLPIDTTSLRFLLSGDPTPVLDFETRQPRSDAEGRPLFKVPVVITGGGEKRAPAVDVTVPGPIDPIEQGSTVVFTGLTLRSWQMRGTDGRDRNGVTLRAAAMAEA